MNTKRLKNIRLSIVIIIFILLITGCGKSENATIKLNGDEPIVIHQNDKFVDPGYEIVGSYNKNDYYINIDGFVDTNKMGSYTLTYMLYNKKGVLVSEVTRQVIVLDDNLSNVTMYLKGDKEEYYFPGDYVDHGVEVYNNNKDISDQVEVNGNLKANEVGKYVVKYQIINGNNVKEITRKVNIVKYNIERKINEKNQTITLTIKCDGFSYVLLPDGTKEYSKHITYLYNKSGKYEFDIYLTSGSHKKYIVEVKKTEPTVTPKPTPTSSNSNVKLSGSCSLSYKDAKTTITTKVNKPSQVSKYIVNGLIFKKSPITISGISKKVTVIVYNKANKPFVIKCEGSPPNSSPANDFSYGFKPVNYSKVRWYPCGNDITQANKDLADILNKYGEGTRASVALAALYLANYHYDVQYFWAGKYNERGFNPRWGCPVGIVQGQQICSVKIGSTECQWGLDCSGFTKWAYVNGGFPENIIPRSSQEYGSWGGFNASQHLYAFGNMEAAQYIKPGDLVAVPNSHVGVVIGVDGSRVQIAHESGGIKITTVLKSTGKSTDDNGDFTHFVLMDEFYKMHGKG